MKIKKNLVNLIISVFNSNSALANQGILIKNLTKNSTNAFLVKRELIPSINSLVQNVQQELFVME